MIRTAAALAVGFAAGRTFENRRPGGTRWANRELVKLAISLARSS